MFLFLLLFTAFILFPIGPIHSLASVLISSPFDNFRIECPQASGAQRLAIRMVESQGQKRQDTVFVLSCQHILELYPWLSIPDEIAEIEREDCHYTQQFDILLDHEINWTCKEREYIAGIARLSDTRIQIECCRMRTREEAMCVEEEYGKPIGSGARIEIEHQAKLINALSIDNDVIRVRFCDLAPRQIDAIMAEARTTKRTTFAPLTSRVYGHVQTTTAFSIPLIDEPILLNSPRHLAKQKAAIQQVLQRPAAEQFDENVVPSEELAQVDESPMVEEPSRNVKFTSDMMGKGAQNGRGAANQPAQQQQQVKAVHPAQIQQIPSQSEQPSQMQIGQGRKIQINSIEGVQPAQQPGSPIENGQMATLEPPKNNSQVQQIPVMVEEPSRNTKFAHSGKILLQIFNGSNTLTPVSTREIVKLASESSQKESGAEGGGGGVVAIPSGENRSDDQEEGNRPIQQIGQGTPPLPSQPIHAHGVAIQAGQVEMGKSEEEAGRNAGDDLGQKDAENSDKSLLEEKQPTAAVTQQPPEKEAQPENSRPNGDGMETQEAEKQQKEPPKIIVRGQHFRTIQFGRIVQAVQERERELAEKMRQHGHPPRQPSLSGDLVAANDGENDGRGRAPPIIKTLEYPQQNGTTNEGAALIQATTMKSTNQLNRRKAGVLHEFTITLRPPKVGEPIQPGINADRQRQQAELAIQQQVDAIRAIERGIEVDKDGEKREEEGEGEERPSEERDGQKANGFWMPNGTREGGGADHRFWVPLSKENAQFDGGDGRKESERENKETIRDQPNGTIEENNANEGKKRDEAILKSTQSSSGSEGGVAENNEKDGISSGNDQMANGQIERNDQEKEEKDGQREKEGGNDGTNGGEETSGAAPSNAGQNNENIMVDGNPTIVLSNDEESTVIPDDGGRQITIITTEDNRQTSIIPDEGQITLDHDETTTPLNTEDGRTTTEDRETTVTTPNQNETTVDGEAMHRILFGEPSSSGNKPMEGNENGEEKEEGQIGQGKRPIQINKLAERIHTIQWGRRPIGREKEGDEVKTEEQHFQRGVQTVQFGKNVGGQKQPAIPRLVKERKYGAEKVHSIELPQQNGQNIHQQGESGQQNDGEAQQIERKQSNNNDGEGKATINGQGNGEEKDKLDGREEDGGKKNEKEEAKEEESEGIRRVQPSADGIHQKWTMESAEENEAAKQKEGGETKAIIDGIGPEKKEENGGQKEGQINDQLDPQGSQGGAKAAGNNISRPDSRQQIGGGHGNGRGKKRLQIYTINLHRNETDTESPMKGEHGEGQRHSWHSQNREGKNLTKIDAKSLRIHSIDLKQLQKEGNGTLSEEGTLANNNGRSEEVKAADQSVETMFPMEIEGGEKQQTQKELENVREASAELLHSIAGMVENRQKARKTIDQIKENTGIGRNPPPATSREFAETMFREIEEQEKATMKESMEVLAQLGHMAANGQKAGSHDKEVRRSAPDSSSQTPATPPTSSSTTTTKGSLFTSPQPLANLTHLFSEDEEAKLEDISVERPAEEKEKTTTIGSHSNGTENGEEANSTKSTPKEEGKKEKHGKEEEEEEEYESEEEEEKRGQEEKAKGRSGGDGKEEQSTREEGGKMKKEEENHGIKTEEKAVDKAAKGRANNEGKEGEGSGIAGNNLAKAAKTHAIRNEGAKRGEGSGERPIEGGREEREGRKGEEEVKKEESDEQKDQTTFGPLSPADLPPLDAFPSPPPSSNRVPLILAQLPQLPPKSERKSGQQQFAARTVTERAMKAGEDYEVVDEEEEEKGKKEKMREEKDEEKEDDKKNKEEEGRKNEEKAEEKGKDDDEEAKKRRMDAEEKEGRKRDEEGGRRKEGEEKVKMMREEAKDTTESSTTIETTNRARPKRPPTTRVPLYKRRQLDRIALQVFGPAAFDPTDPPPTPVDAQHHQEEEPSPPRRVFPARRPRPKTPAPPLAGSTGLPDEETDNSPFDAERAQLLKRLRQAHRAAYFAAKGEENYAQKEEEQEAEEEGGNGNGEKHEEEQSHQQAREQPDLPQKRPAGRFGRLEGRGGGGGRFEKEEGSPFDTRRTAGAEGEDQRKGDIRRKPSIDPTPPLQFADADIGESPRHSTSHKDGTPMFAPKDNRPMQIPTTFMEQTNSSLHRIRVGKRPPILDGNNGIKEEEGGGGGGPSSAKVIVDQDILVPMNTDDEQQNGEWKMSTTTTGTTSTPNPTSAETTTTTASIPDGSSPTTTIGTSSPSPPPSPPSNQNPSSQNGKRPSAGRRQKVAAVDDYWAFWTTKGRTGMEGEGTTTASPFYNAHKYFRMPSGRGKASRQPENVLTFCSKSLAVRDSTNLPIACAGEDGEVWSPPRCPPGTACLPAADSLFHICCPVSAGRR